MKTLSTDKKSIGNALMRHRLKCCLLVLCSMLNSLSANDLVACPYCGEAEPSFSEQIAVFDVVVLGKFTGGEKADRVSQFAGVTQYEVIEIIKAGDALFEKRDRIEVDRYRHSEKDGLVLLMGNQVREKLKWNQLIDMTPASFKYLSEAPGSETPTTQRLTYFLKHLEHSDQIIASDAFSEFAIAPYEDIVPLAPLMNPDKVRGWLANPKEPANRFVRLGLYGLMLGLCGQEEDANFLKSAILNGSKDYKFGIDGMTSGYLLIAGTEGFTSLEKELLENPNAPQTQFFPVLQALRFMWTYSEDQNAKPQLIQAMRSMLKQQPIADLVILDLARWKDWESMDKIVSLYGKKNYDIPSVKRAILRYLLAAERTTSQTDDDKTKEHVKKARNHLKHLREIDPKTAKEAQRYLFE